MFEELAQRIQEYLDSQNWNYSFIDGEIQLSFDLDNQLEECVVHIGVSSCGNNGLCMNTRAICPLTVKTEKKDSIVEFVTRANYGMTDGRFLYLVPEGRTEEGMIEYDSWLYCGDTIPSLDDIGGSLTFPIRVMRNYGDALFNVLQRNADPQTEIQCMEG